MLLISSSRNQPTEILEIFFYLLFSLINFGLIPGEGGGEVKGGGGGKPIHFADLNQCKGTKSETTFVSTSFTKFNRKNNKFKHLKHLKRIFSEVTTHSEIHMICRILSVRMIFARSF